MKRKVCVVITARPSYARVKTALEAITEHQNLELKILVFPLPVLCSSFSLSSCSVKIFNF